MRSIGTGGGSRSKLWKQIKANMLDVTYLTPKRSEGAVMADALLAAYVVGDIHDIKSTARQWIEIQDRYSPKPENTR